VKATAVKATAVKATAVRAAAARSLLALLAAAGATGCAGPTTGSTEAPTCGEGTEGAANGVVLMAQSVRTASWVPCLRAAVPLGWDFEYLDARNGKAAFQLGSDRDGQRQEIDVRLEPSCDTAGSTEIRSDRDGMQRFERVTMTTPQFEGERYYVFDGGCIVFDFRLTADNRGEPLALATQVVGAVSRADLRDQVHEESDGRLQLDPPEGDG
jgi:hypothetical protein